MPSARIRSRVDVGADVPFVGRQREVDGLASALDDALEGQGRLVLIAGEPGIGKSRLMDELATRARGVGARVVWGRCWEAGGAPPYWPWVQVTRSLIRDAGHEEAAALLGSGASGVTQMVPELLDQLPDAQTPVSSDPEAARFRLFDATMAFLRNAARVQPLVIIVDDLQAADPSSLLLLRFIAGDVGDVRLLVVGAYRDEGTPSVHLATTLAEVERQPASRHLRLTPLADEDVALLVGSVLGTRASASVMTAIKQETEGNPLFVVEVVRLLLAEGDLVDRGWDAARITIPPRIREVIGRRLSLLSEPCRGVLALAAVLGREFGLDALARASAVPSADLLEILGEAAAARVVTQPPGTVGRMRFSHALLRDAIYEELPPSERVRAHLAVGQALEHLYGDDPEPHLAELALHFCEASPAADARTAIDYARRAGERAVALLAYEEGARLLRLALQILEGSGTSQPADRCRLLLALGDAQAREGVLEGARQTFLRAADAARKADGPELLAAAALGYGGRFVWSRAWSDRRLVPLLQEGLEVLPDEDSALRARLLARLAGALRDHRSPAEQDRISRQAAEMARRIGDTATLAYTLEGRFAATWWPDNAEQRLETATEILHLAREAGDPERIAQGLDWHMIALLELGDIAGVDADLEAASMLMQELGQPAQRWLVLHSRAMRALFGGRFEEAEGLISEAMAVGERAQEWDAVHAFRLQLYFLRREQGRLEEIEAIIRRSVAEYPTRHLFRCLLAHLFCELERPDEARRMLDELAVDGFAALRRDEDWLFEMGLLAEVIDAVGDLDRARTLHGLLSPYPGHVPTGGEVALGSLSRYVGILASMLGRWEEATGRFEDAFEHESAMGARPWIAYTRYEHARTLLGRDRPGDRDAAEELLADAAALGGEMGMRALGRKITTLRGKTGLGVRHVGPTAIPGVAPPSRISLFRREGEYWSISFEGDAFRLKDSKGLRYLARLLARPGRESLALELATAGRGSPRMSGAHGVRAHDLHPSSGDVGDVLDQRAIDAYRLRLRELQEHVDEAEALHDPARAAQARDDMDAIAQELASAVGIGGRSRKAASDAERARVSVTKAVRAAIARIGEHSPALGRHLTTTIRTGTYCSYVPDPRVPISWQI